MKETQILDDKTIIKAQNGDTEAFSEIYRAYYKKVYFIAHQYFRDEEMAKDIVQETFILVHKKINQLREPKTFPAWLRKVTYSLCVNQSRKKQRIVDLGEGVDYCDIMRGYRLKKLQRY